MPVELFIECGLEPEIAYKIIRQTLRRSADPETVCTAFIGSREADRTEGQSPVSRLICYSRFCHVPNNYNGKELK